MSISETAWDGAASRYTPQEWKRACLIDQPHVPPYSKQGPEPFGA